MGVAKTCKKDKKYILVCTQPETRSHVARIQSSKDYISQGIQSTHLLHSFVYVKITRHKVTHC